MAGLTMGRSRVSFSIDTGDGKDALQERAAVLMLRRLVRQGPGLETYEWDDEAQYLLEGDDDREPDDDEQVPKKGLKRRERE